LSEPDDRGPDNPSPPDLADLPPPAWPDAPRVALNDDSYLPYSKWSYGHFALALVSGIIIGPFLAVLAVALLNGPESIEDTPTLLLLTVQAVSSFLVLFILSRWRGSGSWRDDFGFVVSWRHLWGLFAGMVLQIAVALITYPLVERFAADEGPQQEIAQVASSLSGLEIAYFALLVAVLTPIFEEVVFRGMLLGRLVKSMSRRSAALVSALAFAATHLLDPNALLVVPGLFLVGLALAYVAYYSRNLSLPIFVHMGVNGLAVLLLAYSDQIEELFETVEGFIRFF